MSITHPFGISQQKIKSAIKEIIPSKEDFSTLDNTKCFDTKKNIVVESELDKEQAIISGIAFDYLARFYVAKKIKINKEKVIQNMIAGKCIINFDKFHEVTISKSLHSSFNSIIFYGDGYSYVKKILNIDNESLVSLVRNGQIKSTNLKKDDERIKKIFENYNTIIKKVEDFIYDYSNDENEIIELSLILSKLDRISRNIYSTIADDMLSFWDNYEIIKNDLKKLLVSFKNTFLKNVSEDSVVVFNPKFGLIGSLLVGGSDADIYIDGTLYDFKITKKNGWSSSETTQIIAYYLLNLIAKKTNDSSADLYKYPIKRVALYKVRFEEIAYFDCSKFKKEIINNTIENICFNHLFYMVRYIPEEVRKEFKIPYDDEVYFNWNWTIDNPYNYNNKDMLDRIANRFIEFFNSVDVISILTRCVKWEKEEAKRRNKRK